MDPEKDQETLNKEILAALNLACCWMGGTKDAFQAFCAGFATGMGAGFDLTGKDRESYCGPDCLGEDREKKLMAGALSIIEQYNMAMERDAAFEETHGTNNRREAFRQEAMDRYAQFLQETRRMN